MKSRKIIVNKLELLNSLCGNPTAIYGDIYFWHCPFCVNDTSNNNLSYNKKLDIAWCFSSNGYHSTKILKYILPKMPECKFEYKTIKYAKQNNKTLSDNFQLFLYYKMYDFHKKLLKNNKFLTLIQEQRAFTKETIEHCKIGLDTRKLCYSIPIFEYSFDNETRIINFEYRSADKTKKYIYKERNALNRLAQINCKNEKTRTLVIFEGFIDAITFYQYEKEQGEADFYHICTASNGVNSTLEQLTYIDKYFPFYKNLELNLDNDEAGREASAKIITKYPQFKLTDYAKGFKDFNDYYKKQKENQQ